MSISANFPNVFPSLELNFAQSQQLDPRITFSRSTTAPYYDGKTSVLAEQNLLLNSQTFSNAAWTKQNATITDNFSIAPDGTTTASKLTANTSAARIYQGGTTGNVQATASIWIKRRTGTGNVNWEIVGVGVGPLITVTSSWQQVTYTATVLAGGIFYFGLRMDTAGDEIDIWGAQLEQRSSATAYNATTTTPITNYIPQLLTAPINAPRFDFNPATGGSLGLLIEQSSTNLFTYSQDFSNVIWVKSNSTIAPNAIVSPDGTTNASKLVESATTAQHYISETITASAVSHTFSVFAKAGERSFVVLEFNSNGGGYAWFNLSTGAVENTGGGVSTGNCTITSVGNGWYRCSINQTLIVGIVKTNIYSALINGSTNYSGDGYSGVYIWGAQLEALPFATSYIPTTSAQVTRASDNASMTGTNFSSWFNQGQGTVYCESSLFSVSGSSPGIYSFDDGTTSNALNSFYGPNIYANSRVGGANVFTSYSSTLASTPTFYKQSFSYANANYISVFSGGTPITQTSGVVPSGLNRLQIGSYAGGYLNGRMKKLSFYPQALPSNQLQTLTGY